MLDPTWLAYEQLQPRTYARTIVEHYARICLACGRAQGAFCSPCRVDVVNEDEATFMTESCCELDLRCRPLLASLQSACACLVNVLVAFVQMWSCVAYRWDHVDYHLHQ